MDFCKTWPSYSKVRQSALYIMITPNFFHMCFFTCFFFLGGLWTIFMIILTHNLFAEALNSWLTFGHSFWHFVVDDFVVRCRRRSHADQWIKTNKFSSNFQVEIQTEINLFSNLFPSKFQYKKSSPTSQKHFCSEETHMEKCQRYHTIYVPMYCTKDIHYTYVKSGKSNYKFIQLCAGVFARLFWISFLTSIMACSLSCSESVSRPFFPF